MAEVEEPTVEVPAEEEEVEEEEEEEVAPEVADDEYVPEISGATEIKLFGKWAFDDIEVRDISLVDYIACKGDHATYLPHTARSEEHTPEKECILSHPSELISLFSRGRQTRDQNRNYTYHTLLPPELADTVKQLIKRGDQHAADLFDQLMSNQIISQWFDYDCRRSRVFHQSIVEMTKAGQSKVFFKDSIFQNLHSENCRDLPANCVCNGRVDILNECLKKLQGRKLYAFYCEAVYEIVSLAIDEDDPRYDIKLAKDLIAENLEIVKSFPPILSYEPWEEYQSGLRLTLLKNILRYGTKNHQQLMSLLEFMFTEYQMAGIVIKKDEALQEATIYRNHEFDQFFLDNLPD